MSSIMRKPRLNLSAELFDVYLIAAVYILITGGGLFLNASCLQLIDEKPWVHRLALSMIALVTFFAVLFFLKFKPGQSRLLNLLARIQPTKQFTTVLFLYLSTLWTLSSWIRYDAFHSGFDLAIFTQALWNTLHGNFLYSSIKGGICLLADHFSPGLLFFLPFYAAWPSVKMLLLVQAAGAASGILPLYQILKLEHASRKDWQLAFLAAFALYLPLRNSVRFDFHPEILAIPFLLWAYFYFLRGRQIISSLFLLATLLLKESAAVAVFGFGAYALLAKRSYRYGAFWMIFPTIYFFIVTGWAMPALNSGQEYFYLKGNFGIWTGDGGAAGLKHILRPESLVYLLKIYLPVGFLSFLHPAFLLNLPMLAQNLGSTNPMVRSIYFQYTAFLTPVVFISAIKASQKYSSKLVLLFFILSSIVTSGVPEYYIQQREIQKIPIDGPFLEKYLGQIPGNVSLRTHEFFAAHAARRKELHIFENRHPKEGGSEAAMNADRCVLHNRFLSPNAEQVISQLTRQGYYLRYSNRELYDLEKT